MSPLNLAILNLSRRRIPTIIAITSIAISVACSGVLLKLYRLSGSRFDTIAKGPDAIVGAKAGGLDILLGSLNLEGNYPGFIPLNLFLTLRAEATVNFEDGAASHPDYLRSVIPFVYFGQFQHFRLIGTDSSFFHRPDGDLNFASGNFSNSMGDVVLGSLVAAKASLHVGDTVAYQTWTGGEPSPDIATLKVSGILDSTHSMWDRALYSSLPQAQQILNQASLGGNSIWKANVLNYFLVYLKPGGLNALESLINKRTVAQVVSAPEQIQRLEELTGTGERLGLMMTLAIMALSGLGVAAMMVTRFEAMTLQLAILRAIGYSRGEIGRWLLWEGFILGFSASLSGAVLDWILFPWIRHLLGSALPATEMASVSAFESFPVWITAITMTILAIVIPLYRLYRQDVHLSLKGV